LARELVRDIYALLATNKDFGFNSQIQRAAVSIMNNIAEDLGYINAEEAKLMRNRCTDISFKIEAFIEKLRSYDSNIKSPTAKLTNTKSPT